MRKVAVLASAALVLAVTACGELPDRGIVTAHDYDAPWMQQVCYAYGKYGNCTAPGWIHHNAEWSILVDPNTAEDGGEVWVNYSQDVFETFPIGSVWVHPNPEA